MPMAQENQVLVEKEELGKTISRMAHETLEKRSAEEELALIGIRSRGAHLARRIGRKIEELSGKAPPVGIIDVTAFRDDRSGADAPASFLPSEVPVSVDDKMVVLVDDVIYTGRTIRAALERVSRLGKPKIILVAILVDRGDRELPIKADIVGKNVAARDTERVNVLLEESDGTDRITLTNRKS